jgi:hypothetical protein
MSNGNGNGNGDSLKSIFAKYGFASGLVIVLLGILHYDFIEPQKEVNKMHAKAAQDNAVSNALVARLLQEIRDDQRSGAWNKKGP